MKKYGIFAAFVLVIIMSASLLYAQQNQQTNDDSQRNMGMGMGMMGDGGYSCMMGEVMAKSMVSTPDGGVIVLSGNKLIKYDSNLNQQKEATIPANTQYMNDMMNYWNENCPWMSGKKR